MGKDEPQHGLSRALATSDIGRGADGTTASDGPDGNPGEPQHGLGPALADSDIGWKSQRRKKKK